MTRACTSQLCPERAGLSWEGRGGGHRGGEGAERRIEPEPVEEERSGEAGDGRGRPTADALNLTDGEG